MRTETTRGVSSGKGAVVNEKRGHELTHVGPSGAARMVDVSDKPVSSREAEARALITMQPSTLELIRSNAAAKGDVLGVARVAGIMAAKRTPDLIPLCHSVPLTSCTVDFHLHPAEGQVEVVARARTDAKTGVEMEALTAASLAALTIYDMCKAVDRGMVIGDVRLMYKSGGKSGTFRADP